MESDDIIVRCRSCTAKNEIVVWSYDADDVRLDGYYELREGESFSCCRCGRFHPNGTFMTVIQEVAA